MSVTENPDSDFERVKVPESVQKISRANIEVIGTSQDDYNVVNVDNFFSSHDNVLLVLNQKIEDLNEFKSLLVRSELIVCADGGANRFFDACSENGIDTIPDFIVGDLDSLREDVRKYYENKGTIVKKQSSQYATDFTKCIALIEVCKKYGKHDSIDKLQSANNEDGLMKLAQEIKKSESSDKILIYCLGALGGRFDHSTQMLSQVYKVSSANKQIFLLFLNGQDFVFRLAAGKNFIKYTNSGTTTCGLLPVFGKVRLTTQGLKWDVSDWESSISSNVSSSNRLLDPEWVYVVTDDVILMNIAR